MSDALHLIEKKLKKLQKNELVDKNYRIPAIWYSDFTVNNDSIQIVPPADYFLNRIAKIKELSKSVRQETTKNWTQKANVYNMFVRYTTAFDHNGDGIINIVECPSVFRETGTFLKSIALLPYIQSLGVNTIYLLPITLIGVDGKKGSLGSPYAIKNPYKIDDSLYEPLLELDVDTEFKAFAEAVHLLGMKLIVEFVFRTASIDSELAIDHPDWFYWIKEDIENRPKNSMDETKYGQPIFTEADIKLIKEKIENNDFKSLPEPHAVYKNFFTPTPKLVARNDHKICGVFQRDNECRIPGAFADWPPDDNQPVWSDVTYLKLYDNPDFNYIAYNTVRMYDIKLAIDDYVVIDLWEHICEIIPYYQKNFEIDGVMIDMGHALPSELREEIVNRARTKNPDFIFWEENFVLSENSVKNGYNAVVGYLPFDAHIPAKMKELVKMLSDKGSPIAFFGTAENHNTHRTAFRYGSIDFSKFIWAFINFIPCIPFIHSGFEIGEKMPVNTGLGFTQEEIAALPSGKLPLFSESALRWDNPSDWTEYLKYITNLRKIYLFNIEKNVSDSIVNIENKSDYIISFIRILSNERFDLLFLGNMNPSRELYFIVRLPENYNIIRDVQSGSVYQIVNNELIFSLKPFQTMIGEIVRIK